MQRIECLGDPLPSNSYSRNGSHCPSCPTVSQSLERGSLCAVVDLKGAINRVEILIDNVYDDEL